MSQTAVLVWLSASSLLPTFRADLDRFAHSRLLRFEAPHENAAPFRASAYAPDAVAQLEALLEEARNAAASLEQSRALAALQRADHLLRDHPELPQSAWLMAEILELSAEVESTAPDATDAKSALRQRATALAGPRAAPFSDQAPEAEPAREALRPVSVDGVEPGDTLEWDGVAAATSVVTTTGEHHARVARNGRLLWAGWAQLAATETRLRLPVPETVPCSTDDIGEGHFQAGLAVAAPHARCTSYVLARVHPGGGIDAALCERDACDQVQLWAPAQPQPTLSDGKQKLWPYWVAASAGALAITGIVLWRSGAFDRPAPATSESWVFHGQQQLGLRF